MFHNPVLVTGFPTLRRPDSRPGLVLPLGIMASLVQSEQVVQYGPKAMMKGFNVLLVATMVSTNLVLWHLLTKTHWKRYDLHVTLSDGVLKQLIIVVSGFLSVASCGFD